MNVNRVNRVFPGFWITFVSFYNSSFCPWSPAIFAHAVIISVCTPRNPHTFTQYGDRSVNSGAPISATTIWLQLSALQHAKPRNVVE